MENERTEGQSSPPNSPDAKAQRDQTQGRLYEILAVLALTGCVALLWHGIKSGSPWEETASIIPLGIFVWMFISAVRCATRVYDEIERVSQKSRYVVSRHRIQTLEQVKAPKDVTDYLQDIVHPRRFITQNELLGKLRGALGSERTKEVKDVVLKYTRVDEEQPSESSSEAVGSGSP